MKALHALTPTERKKELEKLKRRLRRSIKGSPTLCRFEPVFGEGPSSSPIVVVGEAPGRTETELKRPFVGRAGKFFRSVLASVFKGTDKDTDNALYITNVVKVWPRIDTKRGRTRPPSRGETEFFIPYLLKELELVGPEALIAVGKTAFSALVPDGEFAPGRWSRAPSGTPVMPVYHPAYILRKQRSLAALTRDQKSALRKVKKRVQGRFITQG